MLLASSEGKALRMTLDDTGLRPLSRTAQPIKVRFWVYDTGFRGLDLGLAPCSVLVPCYSNFAIVIKCLFCQKQNEQHGIVDARSAQVLSQGFYVLTPCHFDLSTVRECLFRYKQSGYSKTALGQIKSSCRVSVHSCLALKYCSV